MNISNDDWIKRIRWNEQGLVPVITQDYVTNIVLMHAWMSEASLRLTLEKGQAVYWSRSRQALWHKGEQSGHFQHVVALTLDCDNDTLLLKVEQQGGIACHTGAPHCFFNDLPEKTWEPRFVEEESQQVLQRLSATIEQRKQVDTHSSYVAQLLHKGGDAILKKIGEEATELVMASKDADQAHITAECADLWFHCLVLLSHHGLDVSAVLAELRRREHTSGLKEKASRLPTSTATSS